MPTTDRHDTPGLFYPVMKILVDCLQVAETGGGDQKLQLLLWNGTGGLARAPYPATATSSPDTWEPCDRPHWYNLCAFPLLSWSCIVCNWGDLLGRIKD